MNESRKLHGVKQEEFEDVSLNSTCSLERHLADINAIKNRPRPKKKFFSGSNVEIPKPRRSAILRAYQPQGKVTSSTPYRQTGQQFFMNNESSLNISSITGKDDKEVILSSDEKETPRKQSKGITVSQGVPNRRVKDKPDNLDQIPQGESNSPDIALKCNKRGDKSKIASKIISDSDWNEIVESRETKRIKRKTQNSSGLVSPDAAHLKSITRNDSRKLAKKSDENYKESLIEQGNSSDCREADVIPLDQLIREIEQRKSSLSNKELVIIDKNQTGYWDESSLSNRCKILQKSKSPFQKNLTNNASKEIVPSNGKSYDGARNSISSKSLMSQRKSDANLSLFFSLNEKSSCKQLDDVHNLRKRAENGENRSLNAIPSTSKNNRFKKLTTVSKIPRLINVKLKRSNVREQDESSSEFEDENSNNEHHNSIKTITRGTSPLKTSEKNDELETSSSCPSNFCSTVDDFLFKSDKDYSYSEFNSSLSSNLASFLENSKTIWRANSNLPPCNEYMNNVHSFSIHDDTSTDSESQQENKPSTAKSSLHLSKKNIRLVNNTLTKSSSEESLTDPQFSKNIIHKAYSNKHSLKEVKLLNENISNSTDLFRIKRLVNKSIQVKPNNEIVPSDSGIEKSLKNVPIHKFAKNQKPAVQKISVSCQVDNITKTSDSSEENGDNQKRYSNKLLQTTDKCSQKYKKQQATNYKGEFEDGEVPSCSLKGISHIQNIENMNNILQNKRGKFIQNRQAEVSNSDIEEKSLKVSPDINQHDNVKTITNTSLQQNINDKSKYQKGKIQRKSSKNETEIILNDETMIDNCIRDTETTIGVEFDDNQNIDPIVDVENNVKSPKSNESFKRNSTSPVNQTILKPLFSPTEKLLLLADVASQEEHHTNSNSDAKFKRTKASRTKKKLSSVANGNELLSVNANDSELKNPINQNKCRQSKPSRTKKRQSTVTNDSELEKESKVVNISKTNNISHSKPKGARKLTPVRRSTRERKTHPPIYEIGYLQLSQRYHKRFTKNINQSYSIIKPQEEKRLTKMDKTQKKSNGKKSVSNKINKNTKTDSDIVHTSMTRQLVIRLENMATDNINGNCHEHFNMLNNTQLNSIRSSGRISKKRKTSYKRDLQKKINSINSSLSFMTNGNRVNFKYLGNSIIKKDTTTGKIDEQYEKLTEINVEVGSINIAPLNKTSFIKSRNFNMTFTVCRGEGILQMNDEISEICLGTWFVVPAGVPYLISNITNEQLSLSVVKTKK